MQPPNPRGKLIGDALTLLLCVTPSVQIYRLVSKSLFVPGIRVVRFALSQSVTVSRDATVLPCRIQLTNARVNIHR